MRIEDKFIVSRAKESELLAGLRAKLTPAFVNDNTRFTLVDSVYLDSANLVSVVYHRLAFEGPDVRVTVDRDVRVTVDRDVRFTIRRGVDAHVVEAFRPRVAARASAPGRASDFDPRRSVIVEVKHASGRPVWSDELLNSVGARETSFSKYCWSMLAALGGFS